MLARGPKATPGRRLILAVMTPHRHEHRADGVWVPCPVCWGQRRLLAPSPSGALTSLTCPGCIGVGERLTGADPLPAPAA